MEPQQASAVPAVPFTIEEARARGLSRHVLRSRTVESVSYGIHRPAEWTFELKEAARILCVASPSSWISHSTAARLHQLILPSWLDDSNELHISRARRTSGVRRKGITAHKMTSFEDEIELDGELRLSTRARAWLDLSRTLPLADLVCMGDQLVRIPRAEFENREEPYATVASLRAMLDRHRNLQGIVRARDALELIRVGSDSSPESLLRLAMMDAGLPEPDLQIKLWDRQDAPSADAGYRNRRIALQYVGAHHLDEEQRRSDKRRDRAFRDAGWTVLVFTQVDLADGFGSAIIRIKNALRHGWIDPSIASGFSSGL